MAATAVAHPNTTLHWVVRNPDVELQARNRDSLAFVYLHSFPFGADIAANRMLLCSFEALYTYMAPTTRMAVYVFHGELTPPPDSVLEYAKKRYPLVQWIPLEKEYWTFPEVAERRRDKFSSEFSDDYRLMGHWRLVFPFKYMRALGHRYLNFIDDDFAMLEKPKYNIMQEMDNKKLAFGYLRLLPDCYVSDALAELARYFIVSNGIDFNSTMLRDDTYSHTIEGLKTGGWDCTVIYGYFVTISLDFWFRRDVQEFLHLALATGDHVVHRWNEQGVIGTIRQLFGTPEGEMVYTFAHSHEKDPDRNCRISDSGEVVLRV